MHRIYHIAILSKILSTHQRTVAFMIFFRNLVCNVQCIFNNFIERQVQRFYLLTFLLVALDYAGVAADDTYLNVVTFRITIEERFFSPMKTDGAEAAAVVVQPSFVNRALHRLHGGILSTSQKTIHACCIMQKLLLFYFSKNSRQHLNSVETAIVKLLRNVETMTFGQRVEYSTNLNLTI